VVLVATHCKDQSQTRIPPALKWRPEIQGPPVTWPLLYRTSEESTAEVVCELDEASSWCRLEELTCLHGLLASASLSSTWAVVSLYSPQYIDIAWWCGESNREFCCNQVTILTELSQLQCRLEGLSLWTEIMGTWSDGTFTDADRWGAAIKAMMSIQFSPRDCEVFELEGDLLSEYPVGHVEHTWNTRNGTTLAPEVRYPIRDLPARQHSASLRQWEQQQLWQKHSKVWWGSLFERPWSIPHGIQAYRRHRPLPLTSWCFWTHDRFVSRHLKCPQLAVRQFCYVDTRVPDANRNHNLRMAVTKPVLSWGCAPLSLSFTCWPRGHDGSKLGHWTSMAANCWVASRSLWLVPPDGQNFREGRNMRAVLQEKTRTRRSDCSGMSQIHRRFCQLVADLNPGHPKYEAEVADPRWHIVIRRLFE
jgi:hypothetical protein